MNAELHWRRETLHRQPRPRDARLERWTVFKEPNCRWRKKWIAEFQERVSTSHQWHLIKQFYAETQLEAYALADQYRSVF